VESTSYDAIVIGSGQGGVPLAVAFAGAGMRTAVIERSLVGGTCINYGCTPTKTMVASARVAHLARRGQDFGVSTGAVRVDMKRVRARKREIVESFRAGSERRLSAAGGVELIRGEAAFAAPHELEIGLTGGGLQRVSAERIVINTGARAVSPSIPGLDSVPTLDNVSIMELDTVPEHLVVVGGGYIGLEFGQMFRRFGSSVTVVHRSRQLLGREDGDVAEEVATILGDDGLDIRLETSTTAIRTRNGDIELSIRSGGGGDTTITGSHLLVATGRAPDSAPLNLDAAGIRSDDRGYIEVDERLETSVPGVYAIGDVKPGPAFTHISYDDFRVLRTNLIENGSASIKDRLVPYTVFIDPQLGRVGLTEAEARSRGHRVRIARLPMTSVARALELDESRGFMKAVVDADTAQLLGVAVLGIEGGEIMAALEVAMMARLPYTALRDGIFAHPTLAESFNNLFNSFET
jgi:pyruvate/2-oxoglutarate dehydrogenase complex dihydrolipoamide dehydrogenase (E3) component